MSDTDLDKLSVIEFNQLERLVLNAEKSRSLFGRNRLVRVRAGLLRRLIDQVRGQSETLSRIQEVAR